MMQTCLDEGTLQAYLDGELSIETSTDVAAHLGACAMCAEATRAAEQELAFFSEAFADALPQSVPTEKLRARLDEAIAEINAPQRRFNAETTPATSRLRALFASLVASLTTFTPRQATAFASFLVAFALLVVFALMQTPGGTDAPQPIARVTEMPPAPIAQTVANPARQGDAATVDKQDTESNVSNTASGVRTTSPEAGFDARTTRLVRARVERGGAQVSGTTTRANVAANTSVANTATGGNTIATSTEPVLEDEKTYLRSIASLTSAIEAQGAEGMTPTLRAEYERNLAVVNQAIVSSRVAARRNPQDTDAKEFLRAAYQNKVELLSAIADQTQLASGRD